MVQSEEVTGFVAFYGCTDAACTKDCDTSPSKTITLPETSGGVTITCTDGKISSDGIGRTNGECFEQAGKYGKLTWTTGCSKATTSGASKVTFTLLSAFIAAFFFLY